MQAEIEARFLDVNYDVVRDKLQRVGAIQRYPMRNMKRVIIDYPDQRLQHDPKIWGFIRVRDEGSCVMLAYKQIARNETFDTHEIEFEVSSYVKAIDFFEAIGLRVISEQHTRREAWEFAGCEISLDDWPWLQPMVEIEGPDEDALQSVATVLGLSWAERIKGNAVVAYRNVYPGMSGKESLRDIDKLTLDVIPDWLRQRQLS